MTEVAARQKYTCPSCGAEATWNPAKQALVCAYCGTVSPAKLAADGSTIVEHDLAAALRSVPDSQRGWQQAKTMVKCQSCQAISVFDPKLVAQRCDFCGSAALVPYEEVKEAITPESVLQFKIPDTQVRERIRAWYANRWFAPNTLGRQAMTDTLKGIYLPYWTFDARVEADWMAESGTYYWENETYRDGQGRTQTRRVQKTRWRPASGSLEHFFDDTLVCASRGVDMRYCRAIEPFPTKELVPYDPGYVAGWLVERYQIDLSDAAATSQAEMDQAITAMCAQAVPGDTYRNLQVDSRFNDRTFKHILAPVWLLTYNFGRKTYHVIVNGYTGEIAGDHPFSPWKIAFAILAGLIAIIVALLIFGNR